MKMKKIGIALVVIIVLGAIGSGLGSEDDDATKNTEVTSENVSKEAAKEEQKESDDKKEEAVSEEDISDAKETLSKLAEGLKDKVNTSSDDKKSKKKSSNVVDKDLKKFLDSYEKFVDEYIKFMKKYAESDDTTAMLTDYTKMMSKYTDFVDKLDKYDTDTMSAVDLAYYTKVTIRCSEKLSKASL